MRSHSFEPLSQININSCFIHTNFPEKNFTNFATRMSNYYMKKSFQERKYKSQRADTLVQKVSLFLKNLNRIATNKMAGVF